MQFINQTINGYKYNIESEAKTARKLCADYYGLPKSPESTTIWYVDYSYSELDNFYFIIWAEGVTEVLGEPTIFDITTVNPTV